jgi:hypothetical protein
VTAVPLSMPVPIIYSLERSSDMSSAIYFSHYDIHDDIHAAENDHNVRDGVADAEIFDTVRLIRLGGRTR